MNINSSLTELSKFFFTDHHLRVPFRLLKDERFSVESAILFCYLFKRWVHYMEREETIDGFFYETNEKTEENIGLTYKSQTTARRKLEELGILEIKLMGMPARTHYKINVQAVVNTLETQVFNKGSNKVDQKVQTSTAESEILYNSNMNNINEDNKDLLFDNKNIIQKEAHTESDPAGTSKLNRRSKANIIRSQGVLPLNLPQKETPPLSVPPSILDLIQFWRSLGLKVPGDKTKSYANVVSSLKKLRAGKAFLKTEYDNNLHPYTVPEIKKAMLNFSLAALNPNMAPKQSPYKDWLKTVSISDFIYNPFSRNGVGKSMFIHYHSNAPEALRKEDTPAEDKFPKITAYMINWYKKNKFGDVKLDLMTQDVNKFRIGATKLMEFHKKIKYNDYMRPDTEVELARLFCESIEKSCGENYTNVTPGWFCSNIAIGDRFPGYLNSQGYIHNEVD